MAGVLRDRPADRSVIVCPPAAIPASVSPQSQGCCRRPSCQRDIAVSLVQLVRSRPSKPSGKAKVAARVGERAQRADHVDAVEIRAAADEPFKVRGGDVAQMLSMTPAALVVKRFSARWP